MGMGMGVGGATSAAVGGASQWQQSRQNYNQLDQALKSGNLSAAQQAYTALSANSPNASNPNSPLAQIGQALQTGNLSAAQTAFSGLHAGHHHHKGTSSATSGTSASPAPSLATSGSVGTNVNAVV